MSSYVYMKVLESAPHRYDRGIRMLSRGHIAAVHEAIAERAAAPGARVLDIGCGTGAVSLACAARGADVVGIDVNAEMLAVAGARLTALGDGELAGSVQLRALGAAEIEDEFAAGSLDAVVSCLCFSELSPDEQAYALRSARTCLRPGGWLVVADEVSPRTAGARLWYRLKRAPLAALTYTLTQTSTRPVDGLAARIVAAGFVGVDEQRHGGDLVVVSARRPA